MSRAWRWIPGLLALSLGRAFGDGTTNAAPAAPLPPAPSARVAQSLRDGGLKARALLARSAEDQDLVSALLDWRAGESGA